MLLSDFEIRAAIDNGDVIVSPYDPALVQPASLDIRLGFEFMEYTPSPDPIDPLDPKQQYRGHVGQLGEPFLLEPHRFTLGCTLESIRLGRDIAARIEGKSTLARTGLIVHSTAGFVDPGFEGQLTLEMTNQNHRGIILRPGMLIAQLSFTRIAYPRKAYGDAGLGSHYQHQRGATPAAALDDVL